MWYKSTSTKRNKKRQFGIIKIKTFTLQRTLSRKWNILGTYWVLAGSLESQMDQRNTWASLYDVWGERGGGDIQASWGQCSWGAAREGKVSPHLERHPYLEEISGDGEGALWLWENAPCVSVPPPPDSSSRSLLRPGATPLYSEAEGTLGTVQATLSIGPIPA